MDLLTHLATTSAGSKRPGISVSLAVVIYLVFGTLWVLLSDRAMQWAGLSDSPSALIQSIKGAAFVLVSAGLLCGLIRRQALALEQAGNLLRAVTRGAAEAVFVKDRDGRYLLINEAGSRLLNKPIPEILGKDATALFPPESARVVIERDRRVMESGKAETGEEDLIVATGIRTFLATKAPYFDEQGKVIGLIGIALDITERKRVEARLRDSEERFHALVDVSSQIVWAGDRYGAAIEDSPSWRAFTGQTSAECRGFGWLNAIHPEDRHRVALQWQLSVESRTSVDQEYRLLNVSGEWRWMSARATCLLNPDGSVWTWVGMNADITERKRAEQALRVERDRLTQLAAAVPGVLYSFQLRPDGTQCVTYSSPTSEEIYGLCFEDLHDDAAPLFALTHPDDLESLRNSIAESARSLTPWHAEFRVRHPRKGEIWIEGNSIPRQETDGSIVWHGIATDVTERHLRTEQLRQLFCAVEQSPATVVISDPSGNICYVNPKFTQLTGYTAEEAIGQNPAHPQVGENA